MEQINERNYTARHSRRTDITHPRLMLWSWSLHESAGTQKYDSGRDAVAAMRRRGWKEWKKARGDDRLPNSNKCSALSTIRRSAGCSEMYAHYWQCCPKGLRWGKALGHRQGQHFKHLLNTTRHYKTDNTPSSPKSTQRTKQGGRLILLDLTLFQQNANKES